MLRVSFFLGQQDENPIRPHCLSDRLRKPVEQILQRRDRFQDARRLAHGRLEVKAARPDEETVGKPLRYPTCRCHGKCDHKRRGQMTERAMLAWKHRLGRCRNEPPDQRVKREEISRQDRVGGHTPEKEPDVHDLSRRDAVSDNKAEDDDAEWRELNRDGAFDEGTRRN